MNVHDILREFNTSRGYFPHAAVKAAFAQQKEITPALLSVLNEVICRPEDFYDDRIDHFFAIFLLAQFREKKAFPLILDIARLPDRQLEHLLGDVITEGLVNTMISTYDGNLQQLKSLIEDEKVYVWCRSAGLSTLLGLFVLKQLEREEIIMYLKELLDTPLVDNSTFMSILMSKAGFIHATELQARIEYLVNLHGNHQEVTELHWMRATLNLEREECFKKYLYGNKHFLPIEDVYDHIGWLKVFQEDEKPFTSAVKNILSTSKVGRNDPCVCGSQKKFKKCCLEKIEHMLCGLCGNTKELIRTDCCNNWICNDEYKYELFSFQATSCIRSHRKYTICSNHESEGHQGKWQDCDLCRSMFRAEIYAYYATNDFNFEKLRNPPPFDPIACGKCAKRLTFGKDDCMLTQDDIYFCTECNPLWQTHRTEKKPHESLH